MIGLKRLMKTRTHIALLFAFSLTLPAMADTFTLKDGTRLEAKILREDTTSYVLEVQVTKSIKDERTIAKADVVKVERVRPDKAAFEAIANLTDTPDLAGQAEYESRIRAVEKFIKDHGDSLKVDDAKAIADKLRKEANEIHAGGIKLNGQIISSLQYQSNMYEYDALSQAAKIKNLINAKQFLQALRMFGDFNKDFRNTDAYKDLQPLAINVMKSYLSEVGQLSATYEARVKEREVGLQRMSSSDRNVAENAIREENAQFEEQLKREKDGHVGWVTVHPFLKASIEETLTFGKQEITRVSAPPSGAPVDAGKLYRETLSTIQNKSGDASAVSNAINNVKNAQVPARYVERLEAAAKAANPGK